MSGVEKCLADRRCFVQVPSLGEAGLGTKKKEGLCRKLVKNRSDITGCVANHTMSVSPASICKVSERYCGKDAMAGRASSSAFSARHLTVGTVSCSAPLCALPVSQAVETGNCLSFDNSFVSGCDRGGATCALKSCNDKESANMGPTEESDIPESRNFPNCVKLCASSCEEVHFSRKTRVLNSQPYQANKVGTLQTEGKKTLNQPQTFCDAFSQFLMGSNRTMDAEKKKIEKSPDEKVQCMSKVPLDCSKYSNLRAGISAKTQLDFNKDMLPELRTKMSAKEPQDTSNETPPELKTQTSAKIQLGLSDETFSDSVAEYSGKASQIYIEGKLPDVESKSPGKERLDRSRIKGIFQTDSEWSGKLDQSDKDSIAIACISCVDNSISDSISVDFNCSIHDAYKVPETVSTGTMADQSPMFLDDARFANNLAQNAAECEKLISTEEIQLEKSATTSSNDMKDNGTEETISSCAVKQVTLLRRFTDVGPNSEDEQRNTVVSKVVGSENLDSGISDSEQTSSRHTTTDSSQGSLGVLDTADVAMEPIEYAAMETTEDVAMEMSNWHESQSSSEAPVRCKRSSLHHPDASSKELTEEVTVEDSSDSDASSRLRVLESNCRPVHVLLRRLTSEAIDAFCNHPQLVKPEQPEESPQAKTPKKKDPLLAAKPPRQPKPSKSETKKRKPPKPPSWSKDDLAESITLDLLNWLPDLIDEGASIRRSSSATKRKFDGSVSDDSLDDSTPYIPNFMTHSNFDPPGCSLLEKWRKVCELEQEWLEESGIIPAYHSCPPTASCTSFPPRTGDCLSSSNQPGNVSSDVLHGSLLDKPKKGASAKSPKQKAKPKKREATGTALEEGQSKTPRKSKARRQPKKTEVDVSDEAACDISSLASCQNSAKLMPKGIAVGGYALGANAHNGNTLNDIASNENTPTRNATTACPVTSNPQLGNAIDGNSPIVNCISKQTVSKTCLKRNFITVSIPSGNLLTRKTLIGNTSIASSNTKNTLTGNDSTRNDITANTATPSTSTGNSSVVSFVARNSTNGNSHTKSSVTGKFIVIHSVHRKAKARVSSADKLQIVTDSSGDSLPGKTEPEVSKINNTTVDFELVSKSTSDRFQFGQQKSQSYKFNVLPQLTTTKQLPLASLSLEEKHVASPASYSNFLPLIHSKDSVISTESQTMNDKLQPSNDRFSSTITNKLPAVAVTYGSKSQVPGKLSVISRIKPTVATTNCHASLSTSNTSATIAGIVPAFAGSSKSPDGVTSFASLASTTSLPLTSVSSSLVSAAHAGSRNMLNSSNGSSVTMTELLASSSCSAVPPQTRITELAADSDASKQANIVVTIKSLSDDLKSSSTEGAKSRHDSTEMKSPKQKQTTKVTKPRIKPTSTARNNSLIASCNSGGTASSLPARNKTFAACKLSIKASAREPAQIDGEISDPRCNEEEMSSWLAASMGLYTCPCGAAFSDSLTCRQHQINCSSGPPE